MVVCVRTQNLQKSLVKFRDALFAAHAHEHAHEHAHADTPRAWRRPDLGLTLESEAGGSVEPLGRILQQAKLGLEQRDVFAIWIEGPSITACTRVETRSKRARARACRVCAWQPSLV